MVVRRFGASPRWSVATPRHLMGWRTGWWVGVPDSGVLTHRLVGRPMRWVARDRSAPTQSAGRDRNRWTGVDGPGPEPVGWDRNPWAGTGNGGVGQEPVGWDRNRWAGTGTGGLGPERVGWDRNGWAGTGTGGRGPEPVGWYMELPVSAHHDLAQVTRRAPTRTEQARRTSDRRGDKGCHHPVQPWHAIHPAHPDIAPCPTSTPGLTITHTSRRRASSALIWPVTHRSGCAYSQNTTKSTRGERKALSRAEGDVRRRKE